MTGVALTGNIGSGKSTVARIFSALGVPVFHADSESKLLYGDEKIKNAVRNSFGQKVFNEKQEVDFKKLAAVVFNNPAALKTINEIIHPAVFQRYKQWLEENRANPYTLHEAAVIFENRLENRYDAIINVTAPEPVRMKRVIERDGISEEQFYARARHQWPEEEKNKRSDFVIINDGAHFLIPQVMEIHNYLLKRNPAEK